MTDDIAVRVGRLHRRKMLWADQRPEWKAFYAKFYTSEEGQDHLVWVVTQGYDDEEKLKARLITLKVC